MVSAKMRKYGSQLHCLQGASPAMCKAMIKAADRGLVQCLCECSLNVLKGNVRLSADQKRKLARHKRGLRTLAKNKASLQSKKRILQKGGFLGALLRPVLQVLDKTLLPAVACFLQ